MKTSKSRKSSALSKALSDTDCSTASKFFCRSFLRVLYRPERNSKSRKPLLSCFPVMTPLSSGSNESNASRNAMSLERAYAANSSKFIHPFPFESPSATKSCTNDAGIFKDFAYVSTSRCEMYPLSKVSMRLKSCFRRAWRSIHFGDLPRRNALVTKRVFNSS